MNSFQLTGLIAATYTPLDAAGNLHCEAIEPMVDYLITMGVDGLYVCGSTGEGMSLSSQEREQVAESYVRAAKGRIPVVVQVGHNSLTEAKRLSQHAQHIGADAISATCPSYFKVHDVDTLVDCMSEVASGSPDLPFYYYHIPALTGSNLDIVQFLKQGGEVIPNLTGLKYTDTKLFEFQECLELDDFRYDVLWGCDEMLLGALATGTRGAIGSTYNIAAPLYQQIFKAVAQGDLATGRQLQSRSVQMIRTISRFSFHAAMKAILNKAGLQLGSCRLPQGQLSEQDTDDLFHELQAIGFFEWSRPKGE